MKIRGGDVYVDVRYDEYYGQLAQLCQSDIERPPCIRFKELVEKYLDEGFVLNWLLKAGRVVEVELMLDHF